MPDKTFSPYVLTSNRLSAKWPQRNIAKVISTVYNDVPLLSAFRCRWRGNMFTFVLVLFSVSEALNV
jgi:hypothetical protein